MGKLLRSIAIISLAGTLTVAAHSQTGGAVVPSESTYRLIKTISGSKGEDQAGRFVILDPRSIFYVPEDRKVIAYFEWDGPVGPHSFEALWKNPDGKITLVSDFKYEAKQRRFAGYWELLLSEAMQTGLWVVEARIDGESAGSHSFQIISAIKPAIAENTRKILTLSDLYKKATAATVRIENLDDKGEVVRQGLGFFVDDGNLVAAFQTIDGATRIRVVHPSGTVSEIRALVALHRKEDWVVLPALSETKTEMLVRARADSWSVGDRCSVLNVNENGSFTILDAPINGIQTIPGVGQRLAFAAVIERKAVGAPLLNEYGEVVGMAGGVPFPGAFSPVDYPINFTLLRVSPEPTTAIPISQIRTSGQPSPLSQWAAAGHFMPPVARFLRVSHGSIAKKVQNKNGFPEVQDERFVYKKADNQVTAFVVWRPEKKVKGIGLFRLFGSNNNLILESKPRKMNLDPSHMMQTSTWVVPVSQLPNDIYRNDIYRIDVTLDSQTVWRAFFQIAD